MSIADTLIAFLLAIAMIVTGYMIYLLPQRYLFDRARTPLTQWDTRIPFKPEWVWIYSGLYYPFWLSPILLLADFDDFWPLCSSYVVLLIGQMIVAHILPVKTPRDWRQYDENNSWSERFLGFVQRIDKGGNAFPSMHVAIAVLTTLHIVFLANIGEHPEFLLVWIIPVIIAISTLYTKQHLIVDVPAGAILAVAVFFLHANLAGML